MFLGCESHRTSSASCCHAFLELQRRDCAWIRTFIIVAESGSATASFWGLAGDATEFCVGEIVLTPQVRGALRKAMQRADQASNHAHIARKSGQTCTVVVVGRITSVVCASAALLAAQVRRCAKPCRAIMNGRKI